MSCNNFDGDSESDKNNCKKNKHRKKHRNCLGNKCEISYDINKDKEAIDVQNIKIVLRMNDYLKRMFYSFNSICETLISFLEQIYCIYNELNFQCVNPEIIESYNKAIIFMYESISGTLTDTISSIDQVETQLIKPVEREYTTHKINLTYFVDDSSSLSRYLGSVSNVTSTLINDQCTIDRAGILYVYSKMKFTNVISVNDFRYQLDLYINQTKTLIGFFYKDVEYIKNAIKILLSVISETVTLQTSKMYVEQWKLVVTEIAQSINLIKTCTSNMSK